MLGVLATVGGVVACLAGPAPGRPRGRPFGAYAVSCVARWRCALVAGRSRGDAYGKRESGLGLGLGLVGWCVGGIGQVRGSASNRHFNAGAGWVARVRICMRKRLPVARHPSPPIPQELGTNSKPFVAFAQANTIAIQEITYAILGRPRGRE